MNITQTSLHTYCLLQDTSWCIVDCDKFSSSNPPLLANEKTDDDYQLTSPNFADDSTKVTPHRDTEAPLTYDTKTSFLNFIETLGLLDKYPQKLQLIDALMIRPEVLNTSNIPNDIHLVPYLALQKIMMHDNYRPLCKLMSKNNSQFNIHPVDVLMALLHCCDNVLRQDLLLRLHNCKLAIPFLLPDPNNSTVTMLVWALRSIVCEWKCKMDTSFTSKESRIVDNKGPIVSFLRIGSAKSPKDFSKSRMLNMVIGDQHYFFHWNCPGGSFSRKFVNGMVELSCYLPSGRETDSFSDAVMFLNLRGEARECTMQIDLIKKISFITFVFLMEETFDDSMLNMIEQLAVLPGGLVIMFPDYKHMCTLPNSNSLLSIISEKNISKIDIKDENDDEIKSQIHRLITERVSAADPSVFVAISECATMAQKIGIRVDENNAECKEGHALASSMIQILNSVPPTDAKAQMLPLQGPDLWHKWAKCDKESFQKPTQGNVTVPYFNKSVEEKKKEIRQKQWHHIGQLSLLMKNFTSGLQTSKPSVRTYFLQWLKIFLDDRSRKILPAVHTKYKRIRKELQNVKKEGDIESPASTVVKNLTNELKKQSKLLMEGSLGLEHLFREVGQIYEAIKHHTNQQHVVDCYPRIMVDILSQGYPIELMDGDASHVPITWVSAVLDHLKLVHKRKTLFVVSVVGIQSTGKSTLLNTMFGLQFNVSAGRCTRGAFMQLLPVGNSGVLSQKFCDYVLIVDTEGLRAPELSSNESVLHDNQLATFVIGLADVAIINIYGEAPGDLNDILQTAVHAFIRMKNVSVNLSCHFVHQNVTAVLVDSKTKFGQQTFQDRLNEMTKYAAIAEHCESKYSSFQDVIKFDGATDVSYFPGLWKGDPPMAPVNSGYSDKALKLKSTLMALADTKIKGDSSFYGFQLLLKTLWSAVCRENYIFSFKNTQEVVAYNDLDAAFSRWSWTLHRKMLEWHQQTRNIISNCPCNEVTAVITTCLKKADSMLQQTYIKLDEEMKAFFENSEQSDTLAQWRSRYITRLQHLKDDCKQEAKKHCEVLRVKREGHMKLEAIQKHYRKQLLQQIQQLVAQAKQDKTNLTHKELEKKFDGKWQFWLAGFPSEEYQNMYTSFEAVESQISGVLQELLAKHSSILIPKLNKTSLSERGKNGLKIAVVPKHLQLSPTIITQHMANSTGASVVKKFATALGFGKDKREDDHGIKQALKASQDFFDVADRAFLKVKRKFHDFDKSCTFSLLKEYIDVIESYNEKHEQMFTPEYIVDMAIIFASYLAAEFIKLMKEVKATGNPVETFKRLRETYFNTFLAQYKDICSDKTAAKNLSQLLSAAIEVALVQILPTKIAVHVKDSDTSFRQKTYFKVRVLKDLAAARKFGLFKAYLEDIKSSFESWAECYVKTFCMANNKKNLKTIARSIVNEIIVQVDSALKDLNKSMPIKQWLQKFYQRINETLTIDLGELQDIIAATHIESSSEYFITTLSEELEQEKERIMKLVTDPNSKFSHITKWRTSPHLILCKSVVGCTEQCPFCGEQCELTDPNHASCGKDHFINIHRPECLRRSRWDESKQLVLEICTCSVESEDKFYNADTNYEWHPYKEYRSLYKNWCISNESPKEAPKYWQWFISHYLNDIIQWAGAAPTSINHLNWGAVSQEMAVASLSEVYKVT